MNIEHVNAFKCLGVEIETKLGIGKNIDGRIKKVRNSYYAVRQIFHATPRNEKGNSSALSLFLTSLGSSLYGFIRQQSNVKK